MFGADALADPAEVIEVQPLRWLAFKEAIAPPVGINFFPLGLKCTIATPVKGSGPLPAAGDLMHLNVAKKSCKFCHEQSIRYIVLKGV